MTSLLLKVFGHILIGHFAFEQLTGHLLFISPLFFFLIIPFLILPHFALSQLILVDNAIKPVLGRGWCTKGINSGQSTLHR